MKVKLNIFLLVLAIIFAGVVYYILELEKHPEIDARKNGVLDLSFLGSDVKSVSIKYNDWSVDASNVEGRWYLLSPVYDLAKQGMFESIFSMVEKLKYHEVVTLEDMDKRQLSTSTFGIDSPEAVITLYFENDKIDVVFGKRTRLGEYIYVKSSKSDNIYTVTSKIVDVLPETANDLRDPEMFNIDLSLLNSVKLRSAKAGFVELKKENGEWLFEQPDVGPVDSSVLQSIVEKLTELKIKDYIWQDGISDIVNHPFKFEYDEENILYERYGLTDSDALFGINVVNPIIGDDYSLKISQVSSEAPDLYYVLRNSLPDIFSVIVDEEGIDVLNFSINDLKSKELFRVNQEFITEVGISKEDNRFIMTKTNGVWAIIEPMYAVADLKTISSFLNYFTKQVQIVKFIAPEKVQALKLNPYINLCIGSQKVGSEQTKQKLTFFSSEEESGLFYGKFNDRDDVFELPYASKLVFGGDVVNPFLFYNKTVVNIPTEDINSISTKNIDGEIKEVILNPEGQWVYNNNIDGADMVAVNSVLFLHAFGVATGSMPGISVAPAASAVN
jgi:hypothetical protein